MDVFDDPYVPGMQWDQGMWPSWEFISWYLLITLLGWITFPLAYRLFPALADRGYCNAYAGIALPNEASVALHRSVGFRDIGRFPTVGWKFGAWHDVGWFHRNLRTGPPPGA